jgi:hypothetical protein
MPHQKTAQKLRNATGIPKKCKKLVKQPSHLASNEQVFWSVKSFDTKQNSQGKKTQCLQYFLGEHICNIYLKFKCIYFKKITLNFPLLKSQVDIKKKIAEETWWALKSLLAFVFV